MILAIDGTTASGKGTLARLLALRFGLPHLDTGLLYRAVGLAALEAGADLQDAAACAALAEAVDPGRYAEAQLRAAAAGSAASVVAAHGAVRRALLERQRAFARQPGGAVLDGRDIGTVIAPDAEMKFWIDAEVGERARRRALELQRLGMPIDVAEMLRQLKERDARDAARADAPMRAAPDALTIDTTLLTPEETLARALDWIDRRLRPA